MDYENKHKEEIIRATQLWECGNITRENLEYIFPELKEPEDEKIRKAQLDYWCSVGGKEWHGVPVQEVIVWLEKQGEQKPADKVKPKFNVGHWIINKSHDICLITDIDLENGYYICESNRFGNTDGDIDLTDKAFHLWTIQDAKDGDVLDANGAPFIYKKHDKDYVYFYCGVNLEGAFIEVNEFDTWNNNNKVYPATKEQRDLLFTKMKEAGYEWDGNKKELKKTEQKSIDKIKPKFHEDDWVIWDNKISCHVDNIYQGKEFLMYTITDAHNMTRSYSVKDFDNNAHLWSIQDAKDGDILLSTHNQPFIYNGIFDEDCVGAYCGIDKFGNDFLVDTFSCNWSCNDGVKPATKEQYNILFSKMKDAGYEFNFKKKELKKFPNALEECEIEHIEHGKYYYCIKDYYSGGCKRASKGEVVQALRGKSMMALGAEANKYFIPVKCIVGIKPAWSEEDEKMVKDIIAAIDTLYYHGMVNWLKSLKDRVQSQNMWKPSKEQIIALRWVLNNIPYNKHKEEISGLLDQIKDLFMEEYD